MGLKYKSTGKKLTADQVRAIRVRYEGGMTYAALAKEYGVHLTSIRQIVTRATWGHIE